MSTRLLMMLKPPLPPESDTPEAYRRYHRRVFSWHLWAAILISVLTIGFTWALTPFGLARANEVQQKIKAEFKPFSEKLAEVSAKQDRDSARLASVLTRALASDMRNLKFKSCKATTFEERARFLDEIEVKNKEYKEIDGNRYVVPSCSEL